MTILAERSCAVLRNLQAYFPVLNDLPRHVRDYPEPEITYHTESVSLDLDAKEQEVHLNIPLDVSATERSRKKTKEVTNSPRLLNAWCFFGCGTHSEEHGCDGSGHFQASVVLHASFNLASGRCIGSRRMFRLANGVSAGMICLISNTTMVRKLRRNCKRKFRKGGCSLKIDRESSWLLEPDCSWSSKLPG